MPDLLTPSKRRLFWQDSSMLRQRFSKAMRKQAWHWYVLNLAWTAGPVTYIALHGGYYLGYGKSAAPEVFVYFAGYTIIAGLLAVLNQISHHMVIVPRQEAQDARLHKVIDQLFLACFAVRNAYLKDYEPKEQRLFAGWWSCKHASTDVDGIEEAVRDITGNDALALAFKRVELYRRQGFVELMNQEVSEYQAQLEQSLVEIRPRFPRLASLLEQRFSGLPPSVRFGQPRQSGFIERLSHADEQQRMELATADDVLSMLTLTIELLLGRQIVALYPTFRHFHRLEESKEKFDQLLSDFRLLLRKRNGRIRALIMDITVVNHMDTVHPQGASAKELLVLLQQCLRSQPEPRKGQRRYKEIQQLNERLRKTWQQLHEHEKRYNHLWQTHGERLRHALQDDKAMVHIEETELMLTEKQQKHVLQAVENVFEHMRIRKQTMLGVRQEANHSSLLDMGDFKQIAVELMNILDDVLSVTEPEEQLAIEASRETDFGCVEPEMPAASKIFWAGTMVQEVQKDRVQLSHEFAAALVNYFNVPLSHSLIEQLVVDYGASREHLEQLQDGQQETALHIVATDALKEHLLSLPSFEKLVATY